MTEQVKKHSTIRHIADNKQVVLATIVLGLAIVFVFSLERQGRAETAGISAVQDEFVIEDQENIIQPIGRQEHSYFQADSIIYEKSMGERIACSYEQSHEVTSDPLTDINERQVRVPILMYHYVEEAGSTTMPWLYHDPAVFEAQLKTLYDKCYESLFVSDVHASVIGEKTLKPKSIAITFDDGYEDMYTKAYPLLRKYEMKGTMYIIVNALDKPGYLTRAQVKEMSDSGYVEIAAHTMNHPDLRNVSFEVARYEILGSKDELADIIGRPVTDFAYPYGFFGNREEEICRQAGYFTCASTYPGEVQTFAKRFSLYRLRPAYRVGQSLISWLEQAGPKK